jgi:hypothetical protein
VQSIVRKNLRFLTPVLFHYLQPMTSSLHVYEPGREYPLDAEQQVKLDEKKNALRYENEKFLIKNKDLTDITRFLLASVLKSKPEKPVDAIATLVADDSFAEKVRAHAAFLRESEELNSAAEVVQGCRL